MLRQAFATVGFICCYVDDMMIVGEQNIVEAMAQHIKKEWEATDLERVNAEPLNKVKASRLGRKTTSKEIEKNGKNEEQDVEMVRQTQALSGELLWAIRTRPDICYGVNRISQLIARRAFKMGISSRRLWGGSRSSRRERGVPGMNTVKDLGGSCSQQGVVVMAAVRGEVDCGGGAAGDHGRSV